jgi:hypothetical protein
MVKLSLCLLSKVLCNEDISGNGGIAPPFLTLALDRVSTVSGEIHAPAALTPVPIALEAGWASEPVWMLWRREESCTALVL